MTVQPGSDQIVVDANPYDESVEYEMDTSTVEEEQSQDIVLSVHIDPSKSAEAQVVRIVSQSEQNHKMLSVPSEQNNEPMRVQYLTESQQGEQSEEPMRVQYLVDSQKAEQSDGPMRVQYLVESQKAEQSEEPMRVQYLVDSQKAEQTEEPVRVQYLVDSQQTEHGMEVPQGEEGEEPILEMQVARDVEGSEQIHVLHMDEGELAPQSDAPQSATPVPIIQQEQGTFIVPQGMVEENASYFAEDEAGGTYMVTTENQDGNVVTLLKPITVVSVDADQQ